MDTWALIEAIERAEDIAAVQQWLVSFAMQLGFSSLFGGLVPQTTVHRGEIARRTMIQVFPEEWGKRYNTRGYLFRDPIVHRLRRVDEPFWWKDAYASCGSLSDVKLIKGEASEFGLREGFVVPVTLFDGSRVGISYGSSGLLPDDGQVKALEFATHYAVGRMLYFRHTQGQIGARLTPRELDCILWAADGHTDEEIARRIGVSKPTVIKHLLSARSKLGALNRAGLVAQALRQKIIR